MAPPKKSSTSAPATTPASSASTGGRKPWIKRTPADIVLEQITKQEEKVSELRTDLAREERLLAKMQQVKTAFEAE
jgi:hypothetical protein